MESLELLPARVKITAILKKAILVGEYKSGQELSLVEVSERLGVSRTPVREAFQALAADGLIELRMNKGAIVRPIDEKFIRDHYEMRMLLEGYAVEQATKNNMETKKLMNKARFILENLEDITPEEYSQTNQQIHYAIWKAAGNDKLEHFLMSLWNGPSFVNETGRSAHYQLSAKEHIEILTHMQAKESKEARAIMEKHIERSMHNMLEGLK